MGTSIFPVMPGWSWPLKRTPEWSTSKQDAISGKRTTRSNWTYPRWHWEGVITALRQAGAHQQVASFQGQTWNEFATFQAFFNGLFGDGDSFLYAEPDDNTSPTNQQIGQGDGVTETFQMQSAFGTFVQPIFAFSAIASIKVGGSTKTPITDYDVTTWGNTFFFAGGASTDAPGTLRFTAPPTTGGSGIITGNFSFYFPCQFSDPKMDFSKFMGAIYEAKSVKFESLK